MVLVITHHQIHWPFFDAHCHWPTLVTNFTAQSLSHLLFIVFVGTLVRLLLIRDCDKIIILRDTVST